MWLRRRPRRGVTLTLLGRWAGRNRLRDVEPLAPAPLERPGRRSTLLGRPWPRRLVGRLPTKEIVGPPSCPLLHRWTLLEVGGVKVLLHYFLPNATDRDPHDHPRSFVTIALAGSYLDIGRSRQDRLRAGSVRFRPAEHQHRTLAGRRGCWTLVLMGRPRREWGFWNEGRWWPNREYVKSFGPAMRCPEPGPQPLVQRDRSGIPAATPDSPPTPLVDQLRHP